MALRAGFVPYYSRRGDHQWLTAALSLQLPVVAPGEVKLASRSCQRLWRYCEWCFVKCLSKGGAALGKMLGWVSVAQNYTGFYEW